MAALIGLLALVHWWRFKDVPIDRDFAPYAYPAWFGTGYLKNGHVDIKPPLIHWSYQLWAKLLSLFGLKLTASTLRLLPAMGIGCGIALVSLENWMQGLALAVLTLTPFAWAHMANTEWLTLLLAAIAMTQGEIAAGIALGLLPLANQKNVLLTLCGVVIAVWLDMRVVLLSAVVSAISAASLVMGLYGLTAWKWLVIQPMKFGKGRTLKANSNWALLNGWIIEALPFVACLGGRWWVFVLGVLFLVAFKQIVPHHLILLALFLAIGTEPIGSTWAAWGLACAASMGFVAWMKPSVIYALTFGTPRGNYGTMLDNAKPVERWIRENTQEGETIWVNGMENQIYLNTNRPAFRINIPELQDSPEGDLPRVIVHCPAAAVKCDYTGYKAELITSDGGFVLMVKA